MRVTVRLFARLRDIAGAAELARDVAPGATIGDVWRQLARRVPGARAATSARSRARSTPTTRGWIRWSATATRSRSCRRCRVDERCEPRSARSPQRTILSQRSLRALRLNVDHVRQTGIGRTALRRSDAPARHDRGAERLVRVPEARQGAGRDRAAGRAVPRVQDRRRTTSRRPRSSPPAATPTCASSPARS